MTLAQTAFWLTQSAPPPVPEQPLPKTADVVVIGSGYTGLHTALVTARGGRHTVVLEAEAPGHGCSTRNGGQISTSVKPEQAALAARHGAARAAAIRAEGRRALDWIEDFVTAEGIACDFERNGLFHAAHTPQEYEAMCRDAKVLSTAEGIPSHPVPRSEQHRELGSEAYFGGLVFPRHAALHPAKYHHGLMAKSLDAGAEIHGHCPATHVVPGPEGFTVTTPKGRVDTRDVMIATNGYTGRLTPWLRRRVIPIGSYVIATEEVPRATIDRLFPSQRIVTDSCKVVYYYRASPDRRRVVFGGRVSAGELSPQAAAPRLHADMCRLFPELEGTAITHAWSGTVAYTFDELAHTGTVQGMHYAMGYCGSGVSMSSYLGMRAGQKILGLADGQTAFDGLPHPTRPFYTGTPWFLPWAVAYYRWRDARAAEKARRG